MTDSDVSEERLKQAFALVKAPPGVDIWRYRVPGFSQARNGLRSVKRRFH